MVVRTEKENGGMRDGAKRMESHFNLSIRVWTTQWRQSSSDALTAQSRGTTHAGWTTLARARRGRKRLRCQRKRRRQHSPSRSSAARASSFRI
eukprot:4478972-Pleurochrysis_carterae.AAC.1